MSKEMAPRPDKATGEPRPPKGPLIRGPAEEATSDLASAGKPPEGRGPALEARDDQRFQVVGGSAILVVIVGIAFTFTHGDLTWMQDPVPWGLLAILLVFTVARDWNNTRLTAGADWLRVNRKWVDTYELADIHLSGTLRGWTLQLTDGCGRRVRTYIANIETNRELWALVYNGIVHSVANGATINNVAAAMLKLRPGSARVRDEVHHPKIPDRTFWTILLVVAMVFGAIYLFRPELLGPALGIFAVIVLIAFAVIGVLLRIAHRRQNAIDAEPVSPQTGDS